MNKYKLLLHCLSIIIPAALFISAGASPVLAEGCFSGAQSRIRNDIFNLINNERQSRGYTLLSCDPTLSNIAQAHAEDMYRRNYFSHVSPNGKTLNDRVREGGSSFTYVGENLAMGQNSGRAVVNKWMNSPPHRANILREEFTTMGIGAYGKYYVLILASFTGNIYSDGRIILGSSIIFTNAFPFDAKSALGVVGEERFVAMDPFEVDVLVDSFSNSQD